MGKHTFKGFAKLGEVGQSGSGFVTGRNLRRRAPEPKKSDEPDEKGEGPPKKDRVRRLATLVATGPRLRSGLFLCPAALRTWCGHEKGGSWPPLSKSLKRWRAREDSNSQPSDP